MRRRTLVVIAALFATVVAIAVPMSAPPAGAAASDPPPALIPVETLIPLLQQLHPVLEIISPVVWPQCADATLVTVLGGALGIAVPPQLSLVTGPLLVLCGAVPQPKTNGRVCSLDKQAQDVLAKLASPVLGAGGLPVEVAPLKWVTGLLDNIVDLSPVKSIPIGSTVTAVLQCTDPSPTTPTTVAPGAVTTPTTSGDSPSEFAVDVPTFEDLQGLPAGEPGLIAAPSIAPIVAAPKVRFISQPKFRYPIVMGLPLLFLALVVFFGRSLTRPVVLKED